MKKIILVLTVISLSTVSFARELPGKPTKPIRPVVPTETPYTLYGIQKNCNLTVHEKGFERNFVENVNERKSFFADVSVSIAPKTIFHMKLEKRRGGLYVGYDGNTGLKLVARGAMPGSMTPLAKGYYILYDGERFVGNCRGLWLKRR